MERSNEKEKEAWIVCHRFAFVVVESRATTSYCITVLNHYCVSFCNTTGVICLRGSSHWNYSRHPNSLTLSRSRLSRPAFSQCTGWPALLWRRPENLGYSAKHSHLHTDRLQTALCCFVFVSLLIIVSLRAALSHSSRHSLTFFFPRHV